jgi:hypothetical protein
MELKTSTCFRPRCLGEAATAMSHLNEASSSGGGGQLCGGGEEEEVEGWATAAAAAAMEDGDVEHRSSPNKRHRATPRPHNIQRPCLDFEKMQQVRSSFSPPSTSVSGPYFSFDPDPAF